MISTDSEAMEQRQVPQKRKKVLVDFAGVKVARASYSPQSFNQHTPSKPPTPPIIHRPSTSACQINFAQRTPLTQLNESSTQRTASSSGSENPLTLNASTMRRTLFIESPSSMECTTSSQINPPFMSQIDNVATCKCHRIEGMI